jgi:hypothetical protein
MSLARVGRNSDRDYESIQNQRYLRTHIERVLSE